MATRNRSKGRFGIIRTLNLLAFMPLASRAPLYGRLLWSLATDPRVPASRKLLLGLAAAYVVSPVEIIPDYIPIVGALDDVAVVVIAVDAFLEGLPEGLIDEKLLALGIAHSELEADLARVRKSVPRPVRQLFAKLPDAIDGVTAFVASSGIDRRVVELAGRYIGRPRPTQKEEVPA
jgi:uncharacterized membrane protein YkvA (DUF1232 family)